MGLSAGVLAIGIRDVLLRVDMRRRLPVILAFASGLTIAVATVLGRSEAAVADPVKACAIPSTAAIAGHESVFYLCAENHVAGGAGCGPEGYLLGYGVKYSQRFYHEARPDLSPRGQRWIDDVLVCLQRDLRDSIDSSTSCPQIWSTAYASHPGCYLEAGFCRLPFRDLLRIVLTIDLADWLSIGAAEQAVLTAFACLAA